MTLEELLDAARTRIAVADEELDEARRRRALVAQALRAEFPGCRIAFNGSLAHRDANDPLTDFDIVVVVPDRQADYGPRRKSAADLKERARTAIREALIDEFPDLRIEVAGRKRSVLVRFSDPVTRRAVDFTGDVIIGIDHNEKGLWIPRYASWDRSHPEEHTRLVEAAIRRTNGVYAHAMRLIKYWNVHHGKPFCSWHLKVLAFDAVKSEVPLIGALQAFFTHAVDAVAAGPTPDPAGVGPELNPTLSSTEAVKRLNTALANVRDAIAADKDNRPLRAQAELAKLLPDIITFPDEISLEDEDRLHEVDRLKHSPWTGVGPGASLSLPKTRGWRP